mmetsp:Transcript_92771/g.288654  ORF Transcript_92771/g.288654 Transcript_92771/m.288654 type:complete len:499 (-) Transcript_92771:315-1811(-)
MHRFNLRLPTRADYLPAQDVAQVFKLLDSDGSGRLKGPEVETMFNTMCGCEVTVAHARERYNLRQFTRLVEETDAKYPQFKVSENLMKYLKENVGSLEPDGLCMENCEKLFGIMDKDGTGELSINEMLKMFKFMGVHKLAWFQTYQEFGTLTSAEELQQALKKMAAEHPQTDIDGTVVSFLATVAESEEKPDLDGAEEAEDPEEEAVGKKRALLVGINYIGTPNELGGCINDVRNQKAALIEHFGFEEENIMLLTEDQDDDEKRPTKAKIQEGFAWLFDGIEAGDELFFQYSGHGSQVPDASGTEQDGKNECICPVDCTDGPWPEYVILDNEIYNVFYEGLPDGVRCITVFDCCHSGTVADLQCTREISFGPSDGAEAHKGRYMDPPEDVASALGAVAPAERAVADPDATTPNKLLWTFSGCQDNQTSADAFIGGVRQGALTWSLLKALDDCSWHSSYIELLTAARNNLKGQYTQIPALSTTCEQNYNRWYLGEKPES